MRESAILGAILRISSRIGASGITNEQEKDLDQNNRIKQWFSLIVA